MIKTKRKVGFSHFGLKRKSPVNGLPGFLQTLIADVKSNMNHPGVRYREFGIGQCKLRVKFDGSFKHFYRQARVLLRELRISEGGIPECAKVCLKGFGVHCWSV